jgi:hypothetical protein
MTHKVYDDNELNYQAWVPKLGGKSVKTIGRPSLLEDWGPAD